MVFINPYPVKHSKTTSYEVSVVVRACDHWIHEAKASGVSVWSQSGLHGQLNNSLDYLWDPATILSPTRNAIIYPLSLK